MPNANSGSVFTMAPIIPGADYMTASAFHVLDLHFEESCSAAFEFTMEMDRRRCAKPLRNRLEELVHPVFTACETYPNGRLRDEVERELGLDFGLDPNASF